MSRMGDHRATVKIEFTIHGKTYKMDSWINWFDDGTGVDQRVIDFFRDSWDDARARYDAQQAEYWARENAAKIEAEERATLDRLQRKYS